MKKLNKKINIYVLYTLIFLILSIIVFISFIISGKSFIWKTDGFKQHLVILQNLTEILKNFGTQSWNIGLGLDVIGQLSYYIIGDPFAYISLLFPDKYINIAYQFLIILRIYCVGLSFIIYCNYNKQNKYGTLIGALMYTFSGYILYAAVRHPFFTNAIILLPLMFLGIDKILKEDNYKLFIIITALSAISNYYFFYMLTIIVFIYALTKYISEYKQNNVKIFLTKFSKTVLSYIIGTLISSIILLPTIYAFINSPRTDSFYTYYNLKYYIKLFFMNNNNIFWTKIYVSSIVLFILPISILRVKKSSKNKTILLNILIETIILLFPLFGSIMNGFSFQSNRWCFAYSFFMSYLVATNIDSNLKYTKKELTYATIFLIIYTLIAFVCIHTIKKNALYIAFAFATLLITLFVNKLKPKNNIIQFLSKSAILLIVCCNIAMFSWDLYHSEKYSSEFVDFNKIEKNYTNANGNIENFNQAIDYIKDIDDSFYRIGTNIYSPNNLSIKYKYNGLNTYLSIGNQYVSKLTKELLVLNNAKTDALKEFDSRTKITTLLGCKYYVVSENNHNYVPYGYKIIKEFEDKKHSTYIYKNQFFLPIGVFYNNYTLTDNYQNLSAIEKEQVLLKTAVINDSDICKNYNIKSDKEIINNTSCIPITYNIIDENNIITDTTIQTTQKHNSFKIKFDETKNCELYIMFKNLEYHSTHEYTVKINYNKLTKEQNVKDKIKSPYYEYTPDILINLGYNETHSGIINITLSSSGTYTFDDIQLIAIPMNSYLEDINQLNKYKFNLVDYNNHQLTGTINNNEDGILQISTSYSKGWTAYVDDVKTEIINVNTGFIGIPLASGEHSIKLVYSTPCLKIGIIFSIIGLSIFILIFKFMK